MSKEKTPVQLILDIISTEISDLRARKTNKSQETQRELELRILSLRVTQKFAESIRDNQEKEDRKQLYVSAFVDGYTHEIKHGPTLGEQAEEKYNEKHGNHE